MATMNRGDTSGLRVGLVGAGFIAPFHLRGWQHAGCKVMAIADPNAEAAESRAAEFGVDRLYASVEELVQAGGIDVIDIASPRELHADHVRIGCAAGLSVIVQKPLTPIYEQGRRLRDNLPASARVMVHENWRFRPDYRQLRSWILDGRCGRIRHASSEMRSAALLKKSDGLRPLEMRQPFLMHETRLAISEVMIHHIDALRGLIGDFALTSAQIWHGDQAVAGETAATLIGRAEIGVPVVLTGDMMAHGAPDRIADRVEIVGNRGRAILRRGELSLWSDGDEEVCRFDPDNMLQQAVTGAIDHFVNRLASGGEFETGLDDNLKTLWIVEEAYRLAALTG